jgi:hypothetical protein
VKPPFKSIASAGCGIMIRPGTAKGKRVGISLSESKADYTSRQNNRAMDVMDHALNLRIVVMGLVAGS